MSRANFPQKGDFSVEVNSFLTYPGNPGVHPLCLLEGPGVGGTEEMGS